MICLKCKNIEICKHYEYLKQYPGLVLSECKYSNKQENTSHILELPTKTVETKNEELQVWRPDLKGETHKCPTCNSDIYEGEDCVCTICGKKMCVRCANPYSIPTTESRNTASIKSYICDVCMEKEDEESVEIVDPELSIVDTVLEFSKYKGEGDGKGK